MAFRLALVGRPNVGKSTLFNRLIGKRLALVDDQPGVTRDWREGDASLADLEFIAIDTAGLEIAEEDELTGRMGLKTRQALGRADAALFLLDARAGVTPADRHFAEMLRRLSIPVILAANKGEGKAADAGLYECYELGLGDPIRLSGEHGQGMGMLYDVLQPMIDAWEEQHKPVEGTESNNADQGPKVDWAWYDAQEEAWQGDDSDDDEDIVDENDPRQLATDDPSRPIRMAIVGRPNAGKSTLTNALLGEERVLTGPEPGITRDAITVDYEFQGRPIKLIDTAGMRRRAKINDKLEQLSVRDTLETIKMAQVVVLLMDGNAILDKQDLTIARHVIDEGRALVIAVNKWDAVEDRSSASQRLKDRLQTSLHQVWGVPTVTLSALQGQGLDKLMNTVLNVYGLWNRRISTARLNRWLRDMVALHPPPAVQGRHLRVRYATQIKTRPPHLAIWCSRPEDLPDDYQRYLINGLREEFNLAGIPIRLSLRKSNNPYAT